MIDPKLMNIDAIRPALNAFRVAKATTVKTTEVIAAVTGRTFVSDVGVDVTVSDNAAFGRFLSQHAAVLGIEKLDGDARVENGAGGFTTSAEWKLGNALVQAA